MPSHEAKTVIFSKWQLFTNKIGNVRVMKYWGAFVQPLIEWKRGTSPCAITLTLQLKFDGTRWRKGGEEQGKLAMQWVASTTSHYLGTWCIQHYYRWRAHLGCQ